MMFKKIILGICIVFLFSVTGFKAYGEEIEKIPDGDILIIYSDGANQEEMKPVQELIALITYQGFQVSFGRASDCAGELDRFSHIICFRVEKYPEELLTELSALEESTNAQNKGETDRPKKFKHQIMFIGNDFFHNYLLAGQRDDFEMDPLGVGKVTYTFSTMTEKTGLAKEKMFLFMQNNLEYTAGSVETEHMNGYFCASKGNITHICTGDFTSNLVKAAVMKEIAVWKWPYNGEPNPFAQYIVLNRVFPYQNPQKLLEVINYLIDKKQPFVISVMPVYTNGTYPAMQQFCEILRYAQDNNGTIIMHAPIDQMITFDQELMNKYIELSLEIYTDQGVYPMGLQVPGNWMFQDDTIEVMSHFSTIMTTEETDPHVDVQLEAGTNLIFKDGHQWISPAIVIDDTKVSYTKVSSSAVYLDMNDETEQIKYQIDACEKSAVPLKNLWDIDHSFWTDKDVVSYSNQMITVNGKKISREFVPASYDENYKYNRNMLKRFSRDLSNENSKLIVAVFIVSIIFASFILIARQRNKEKFIISHGDEPEENTGRFRRRRNKKSKD